MGPFQDNAQGTVFNSVSHPWLPLVQAFCTSSLAACSYLTFLAGVSLLQYLPLTAIQNTTPQTLISCQHGLLWLRSLQCFLIFRDIFLIPWLDSMLSHNQASDSSFLTIFTAAKRSLSTVGGKDTTISCSPAIHVIKQEPE